MKKTELLFPPQYYNGVNSSKKKKKSKYKTTMNVILQANMYTL